VQRFAIKTTQACVEAMLPAARARLAETGGTLRFVGHQANLLVLEGVARRSRVAEHEHWHNVVDRGNTGAAGGPTVLSERWGELAKGDVAILAVVGSGLTWSSLRMEVD
jgi:3-oxoacyl-[acyl-carrier-protein] synthase-3